MKKTLLALLLVLCMLVTFTAFTASAEETEPVAETASGHTHCVCGGSAAGVHDHACATITWQPLPEGTTDFGKLASGNYYLTGDVTITAANKPADGLSICLNGFTVTSTKSRLIGSNANVTVNICDCSGEQDAQGKWTWDGAMNGGFTTSYGGIMYTHSKGFLNIYGGNFTGVATGNGSVFHVTNDGCKDYDGNGKIEDADRNNPDAASTLNVYNGNIYGTVTTTSSGGVLGSFHKVNMNIHGGYIHGGNSKISGGNIYCQGTLNITGGEIYDGTAFDKGGNAYCSGTLTVSGGKIHGGVTAGNTTNHTVSNGGNFYVNGSATISGGEIYDGEAKKNPANGYGMSGGNLSVTGKLTVSGGKIYDGVASFYGGNIQTSSFVMTGGEIYGGNASSVGGNVRTASTFTMSDGKIYNGTAVSTGGNVHAVGALTIDGGEIYGGKSSSTGGNIHAAAAATINGGKIWGGTATSSGGNLYTASTLTITDGEIYGGTGKNGGNISCINKTVISGGEIHDGLAIDNPVANAEGFFDTNGASESYWFRGLGGNIFGSGANQNMTISGGKIYDGKANGHFGGNIFTVIGPLTISGGQIWGGVANADNSAEGSANLDAAWRVSGGSVSMYKGLFTMTGGTIGIDDEGKPAGGTCLPAGECGNVYFINISTGSKISGGTIAYGNVLGLDEEGNPVYGPLAKGGNLGGVNYEITGDAVIRDGYAVRGGNITIFDNGSIKITGGTITGGKAAVEGGNIVVAGGNTTTNELPISGGVISNGTAGTRGGDIVINSNEKVSVSEGATIGGGTVKNKDESICVYSGTLAITGDPSLKSICYHKGTIDISAMTKVSEPVKITTEQIPCAFADSTEDKSSYFYNDTYGVIWKEGKLYLAEYIATVANTKYVSLQTAIDAAANGYVKLLKDCADSATVSSDLYLDLAGYDLTGTVTVAEGATLYGMDSTTDDYDCTEGYGTIAKVDGQVAHNFKTSVTGSVRRYVTHTTTEGVVSFHRFYVGITSMTLRPGVTGVGYKATFAGDAVVKSMVEEYGYNLWVDGHEEHAFKGALTAEQFAAAKNVVALLLKNFDVANFSRTPVHATAYIKLNGQTVTTASYYYTLKDLVEHIAADVSGYNVAQMEPLQKMCKAYETVMEGWTNIANILNWKAPEA